MPDIIKAMAVATIASAINQIAEQITWIAMMAERAETLDDREKAQLKQWTVQMREYTNKLKARHLAASHFYFRDGV